MSGGPTDASATFNIDTLTDGGCRNCRCSAPGEGAKIGMCVLKNCHTEIFAFVSQCTIGVNTSVVCCLDLVISVDFFFVLFILFIYSFWVELERNIKYTLGP